MSESEDIFACGYDKYPNVTELDGVPRAYMEIPTEFGRVRITYRTLCEMSKDKESLEQASVGYINAVRAALNNIDGGGIIWWRWRPEIEAEGEGEHRFKLYCRLETSPALSDEFWNDLPVMINGEPAHTLGVPRKPEIERRFEHAKSIDLQRRALHAVGQFV